MGVRMEISKNVDFEAPGGPRRTRAGVETGNGPDI